MSLIFSDPLPNIDNTASRSTGPYMDIFFSIVSGTPIFKSSRRSMSRSFAIKCSTCRSFLKRGKNLTLTSNAPASREIKKSCLLGSFMDMLFALMVTGGNMFSDRLPISTSFCVARSIFSTSASLYLFASNVNTNTNKAATAITKIKNMTTKNFFIGSGSSLKVHRHFIFSFGIDSRRVFGYQPFFIKA